MIEDLGDVIARIRSYAPEGLDSTGVEPSGHSGARHGELELAPLNLPTRFDGAERAAAERRFGYGHGPDDADEATWVLARIQDRFDPPRRLAGRPPLVLDGRPAPLALPAALRDAPSEAPVSNQSDIAEIVVEPDVAEIVVEPDVAPTPETEPVAAPDEIDEQPRPYESVVPSSPARPHRARRFTRLARRVANAAVTAVIVVLFLSQGALGLLPFRASYVLTGSMSPKMPVGSLVITHHVPATQIRVGDVITFADPAKPGMDETHRVVAIENGEHGGKVFATKGDANSTLDPWRIPVTGKVWLRVYSVPRLGYAFGMLHGQAAHLAATLLPAFVLAGWVLVWVWKPVLARAAAGPAADDDRTATTA